MTMIMMAIGVGYDDGDGVGFMDVGHELMMYAWWGT